MIIKKEVSLIFPSEDLGRKIATEEAKVQSQVLIGFANKQLMDCLGHSQPIINLVALMPAGLVMWFVRVYQEIVHQRKIPAKLDREIRYDHNSPTAKEALKTIEKGEPK